MLVGHYGVHIAFYDDRPPLPDRFLGQMHREQNPRFVKHRRARRIEILGGGILVQRPAAKAGHPRLPVADGNHQPPAEKVIIASVVRLPRQPGFLNLPRRIAQLREMRQKTVAPRRAVPELKNLPRTLRKPPLPDIVAHKLRLRHFQLPLVKKTGGVVDVVKRPGAPAPFRGVRQGNPHPRRQAVQRLAKIHPLGLHHKAESVAPLGASPETPPRLAVGEHIERGRAFLVERAVGLERTARPLQGHIAANQINNVQSAFYFVNLRHSKGRADGRVSDRPGIRSGCGTGRRQG